MSNLKSIDIKGKPYIEVNERLKEFRSNEKYNDYTLESDIIQLENGVCTIKATIKDSTGRIIATGFAQEKESSSFINKTSFIENCETSAWGRALGNLGIGIDTSIASADEVLNAIENQKKPAVKSKQKTAVAEIFEKEEESINPDLDIIQGVNTINDLENLEIYYYENVEKVKDVNAFNKAINRRKVKLGGKCGRNKT